MTDLLAAVGINRAITGVSLVKVDPLPSLPPGLLGTTRQATYVRALNLVKERKEHPDKWRADAATAQRHMLSAEYTRLPMARKAKVTDHRIVNPSTFVFSGYVSDAVFALIVGGKAMLDNRSLRLLSQVTEFFEDGNPLFLATSTRVAENMGITELSWTPEGNAIQISISLSELQFADEITAPPVVDESVAELGWGALLDAGVQI